MTVYEMSGLKKLKRLAKKTVKKASSTRIGKIAVMTSPIGQTAFAISDIRKKGIKGGLKSSIGRNISTIQRLSKNPLVRAGVGIIPGGGTALSAIDTASMAQQQYKSAKSISDTPKKKNQSGKSIFNKTKSIFQDKLNALKLENEALKLSINRSIER